MKRVVPILLALVAVLAVCSSFHRDAGHRDAGPLMSGPQPGDALPGPFESLNINGGHAGHSHCLVCEFDLNPVVLVFSREVTTEESRPITKLLQKLDQAVEGHQKAGLKSGAVFLVEDEGRQAALTALGELGKKLNHVVVAVDGAAGPEGYNLNKEADVTVLLYHELKVVDNYAYAKDKLTDKDVDTILAAVDKLLPAKKK